MSVDSFLNEAFDKNKGREVLSFESLCRLVEEVVVAEASLSVAQLAKRNNLKTFIKKVEDGEPFELNSGDGQVVIDKEKSREYIDAVASGSGVPRGLKMYSSEGKPLTLGSLLKSAEFGGKGGGSESQGEKCESMNSTAFEGNILYGLIYLSKGEASAQKFMEDSKSVPNGIVCEPDALSAGVEVAKALISGIKSAGLDPSAVGRTSGGSVSASLTDAYIRHGVKSAEPKADLSIGGAGVSVKQYEASQFVAAQGPELAAILDVVMKNIAGEEKVLADIDSFLDGVERAVGTGSKAHAVNPETGKREKGQASFYQVRDKLAKKVTTKAGKEKMDNTPYQKMLSKALNLSGLDNLEPAEEELLKSAFEGTTAENFMSLRESVKGILNDPGFKKSVVKEGFTGEFKFNEEIAKATALLKWSANNPDKSSFLGLKAGGKWNEEWFSAAAQGAKIEIRDRGNLRGGSMRGSLEESRELELVESFSEQELLEIQQSSDLIYNKWAEDDLMTEGFRDVVQSLGSAVTKSKEWIAKTAQKLSRVVAEYVSKIGAFLKKVLDKGFSYLLQFLGFEPVSLEIKV